MTLNEFLAKLKTEPTAVAFTDTITVIEENYEYTATEFSNGKITNDTGTNAGSCKIFAFGQINQLTEAETLACFGDYYRKDVLENPNGDDHGNIRNFMNSGWSGIEFKGTALTAK